MQFQGSSMLLYAGLKQDPETQKYLCIFYANPLYCDKVFASKDELSSLKKKLENNLIDNTKTPALKSKSVDILGALNGNKLVTVDMQDDWQ